MGGKMPVNRTTINVLDNYSLLEVFSTLDIDDRLAIEKVCRRWKGLAIKSWTSIKNLNLLKTTCTVDDFSVCLNRCKHLEHLTISTKQRQYVPVLKRHCDNIRSAVVHIDQSDAYDIGVLQEFSTMLMKFSKLKYLKIVGLRGIIRRFRFELMKNLSKSLEQIHIHARDSFDGTWSMDFSQFHNLQTMELIRCNTRFNHLRGFENLENLSRLDLTESLVDSRGFEQLLHLKKLKYLAIPKSNIDDFRLVSIINNNRNLEVLDISDIVSLTDNSLNVISRLPSLRALTMRRLPLVTLSSVSHMPQLKSLDCSHCPSIKNEQLHSIISSSPKLELLNAVSTSMTKILFFIADLTVGVRENNIVLKIMSDCPGYVKEKNLSSLLKIVRPLDYSCKLSDDEFGE